MSGPAPCALEVKIADLESENRRLAFQEANTNLAYAGRVDRIIELERDLEKKTESAKQWEASFNFKKSMCVLADEKIKELKSELAALESRNAELENKIQEQEKYYLCTDLLGDKMTDIRLIMIILLAGLTSFMALIFKALMWPWLVFSIIFGGAWIGLIILLVLFTLFFSGPE